MRRPLLAVLAALAPSVAGAQGFPSRPVTLADGRVTLGADLAVSVSSDDDNPAWFNYTGYEYNALRLLRLGVSADVRLASQVSILGQFVSDNGDLPRVHALYVRLRPWTDRAFDIQVGRIPPTFGAFARRNYASGTDNPVIGYPLAYQYLTSLRADAVPATADDLLANRAQGWRPRYPIGSTATDTGVPLVTAFEWDTGVQGRVAWRTLEVSAALTRGTLAEPRVRDNNSGKQVAGRLAWRPAAGLVAGVSGARGDYVADTVTSLLPASTSPPAFAQRAWGADVEYSRGHLLARGEGVISRWHLPAIGDPRLQDSLRAWSVMVEGRYAFWPGAFAAGRYDYLGFSQVEGTAATLPWDAPVARLEVGGGYYVLRNLVTKVTHQHNWREAGVRHLGLWAVQAQFWF